MANEARFASHEPGVARARVTASGEDTPQPTRSRRTGVIVPACSDMNRGDQALMWEADAILRDVGLVDDIVMIGEGGPGADRPQTAQSESRGYVVVASLIDAPRRGKNHEGDKIQDRIASLIPLVGHSLTGLFRSSAILLFATHSRIAAVFMNAEQKRTYDLIRSAAIVVVKGGGFIHAFGGVRAPYYIWFQLFYLRLAHRLGKRVIVLPNSFGPFMGWTVRSQIRRVLSRSCVVLARESISAHALESVLNAPVRVLADMGYFLEAAPRSVGEAACRSAAVPLGSQPCVAFTLRPWRFPGTIGPAAGFARYVAAMAALVRHVGRRGFHPVLVSHVLGPGAHEDDRLALDELEVALSAVSYSRIDHPGDCRDLKAIYGCMDYVVGTRFHSVIFAQSSGVPCLAIGYGGNKSAGIMRDCGLAEFVVPIEEVSAEALCVKFDLLVENAPAVRETMRTWMLRVAQDRRDMAALVTSCLVDGHPAA